jgi:hypothetical protein
MRRAIVAAVLAAVMGAVGGVAPARAESTPCEYVVVCPPTMPPAGPTVNFVFAAFSLIRGGPTAPNVLALIQAVMSASDDMTAEVIVHMDALAAAQSKAAALSAARDMLDLQITLSDDLAADAWARSVAGDASDAMTKIETVKDRRAEDQLGHAANMLYSSALTGYAFSGRVNGYQSLLREYIAVTETLIRDLRPVCTFGDAPLAPPSMWAVERTYTCVAADGNVATAAEFYTGGVLQTPAVNLDQLTVDAAVRSSWLVAVRTLPTLRQP